MLQLLIRLFSMHCLVKSYLVNKNKTTPKKEDIIKDADLVSPEEMEKEVYPAEQVLTEVRKRDIHKKKQKKIKKQTKQQKKENKKNSK